MPCLFYMNLSNSKSTLPSQHSANKMFLHAKILFFNFKREGYCLKNLRKDKYPFWDASVGWCNDIICSNSPVLNEKLAGWKSNSRSPVSSWNFPFWDDPRFNFRYLWTFQVNHTFNKLDLKILATRNKISCSWPPSSSWAVDLCQRKHLLFWH